MGRINILDTQTANAIKAGEVIERPVSVVKELFDNASDAGATIVKVEFSNGGISLLRVTDNGIGMDREDASKCFLVHSTSKIKSIDDIFSLSTQGFRGEALASIASCSRVELVTKQSDMKLGTKIVIEGGTLLQDEECASDVGTVITVKDLFYNTPARYKFLKKDSTEGMYILNLLERLAIINPQISLRIIKDGNLILTTPGNGSYYDAIYCIYGKSTAEALVPIDFSLEGLKVKGFAGKPEFVRGNRSMQLIYVNERLIKNSSCTAAIDEAYRNLTMKGKFPICFIMVYIPPELVDVNVHPQKSDVRFTHESDVFRLIYHGIRNVILSSENIAPIDLQSSSTNETDNVSSVITSNDVATSNVATSNVTTNNSSSSNLSSDNVPFKNSPSSYSQPINKSSGQIEVRAANEFLRKLSDASSNIDTSSFKTNDSDENYTDVIFGTSSDFKPKNDIEELLDSKLIGFLFNTYIVLQSKDNVFLVDQHAAHERVLFEKFLAQAMNSKEKSIVKTDLLVPLIVELPMSDYAFVSDNCESFREHGIDVELLSDRQVAVRSVPFSDSKISVMTLFINLVSELRKELPTGDDSWYMAIATASCKAAIKGNDVLQTSEATKLLDDLKNLNDPCHCPHGRPTFIKMSRTELEKSFKRIV